MRCFDLQQDTDVCDASNGDFQNTGNAFIYRLDGRVCIRRIYRPSPECLRWDLGDDYRDLAPIGSELLAVGNSIGSWCYVVIQDIARKETPVSGLSRWTVGRRARVTFNLDSKCPEDREPVTGWIVKDYWKV